VQLRPVAGLHRYDVPPDAWSFTRPPGQIVVLWPASATGRGFTTTVTESTELHPKLLLAVSRYVVVAVGHAIGRAQLTQLSPSVGLHASVPAPDPSSSTVSPAQSVLFGPASTAGGGGPTTTRTVSLPEQPASVVTTTR
jgi:hypothetical protein